MSGDRKRAEPYELVRDVRKKPRLESPDQEITVHPYDDDFFGSDNESMERVVSGKWYASTQHTILVTTAIKYVYACTIYFRYEIFAI